MHLKGPVSAFLDYLAAPYGPKAVSPTILTAHAGKDFAQNWLKDHDAGTGPFTITKFMTDVGYELTRFDGYWGAQAVLREGRDLDHPRHHDATPEARER